MQGDSTDEAAPRHGVCTAPCFHGKQATVAAVYKEAAADSGFATAEDGTCYSSLAEGVNFVGCVAHGNV